MPTTKTTSKTANPTHVRSVIIIFAVIIVINIGLFIRFFMTKSPTKTNPLWQYVPNNIQQAILIDSSDILAILGDNVSTVSNNPVYRALTTSDHIAILQFGSGLVGQNSAILVDANSRFSATDFLVDINMQDDTDYSFHQYDDSTYLFAQPQTIDILVQYGTDSIADSPDFDRFAPLVAGNSVSLVSRVNPEAAILEDTIRDFIAQTDIFVLSVVGKRGGIDLNAHLLYTEAREDVLAHSFSPSMTAYIDNQTIAYIETSLDGLWTQEEKMAVVDMLRDYDPVLLADIDDAAIASLITNNASLIVQNSPTLTDLRLAAMVNDPTAYALIRSVFPLLQEPLAAMAGLDPNFIQAIEEPNRIAYQATLFGLVPVMLQSYVEDNTSILSLGATSKLNKTNTHRISKGPDNSMGYIFVQFDPFLQLYKQRGSMVGQNVQDPFFVQQEQLLQGKTRAGHITVTSDKVSLWSEIR